MGEHPTDFVGGHRPTAAAKARRAVGARTMTEAFRLTVDDHPDRVAVRTKDDEVSLTWSQLRDRVDALAGGLAGLGVGRGDTVALMLGNRPEFHIADLAAMTLGATPFSIYPTFTAGQIAFVAGDAGAKLAIVEESHLERFLEARAELPALETVVVVDTQPTSSAGTGGARGDDTVAWDDVEGADPSFDPEPHWRAVEPEDVLTLIYTSGTTGPPKGVQLVHRNIMAAVLVADDVIQFPDGSKVISWLPAAHVAERNAHHYLPIVFAMTITCCPNPREIVAFLPAVKPTWFFAVPRIFEKLKAGLEGHLSTQGEQTVGWLTAARRKVELEQAGEPVPDDVAATAAEGDEQLFSGLRAMLGLDEAISVNAGAAPTPRDVLVFFHAIGIPLAELWGMSETTGVGAVNPPERVRIGTVGPPSLGVEMRLADDGELLVRGDVVMAGYRNQPEKTAEAIDPDGWLHTGDIAEFDEEGYVKIVDRKKEIIINAAGKNMSPANIESALKGAGPIIGQIAVIGDARPYNTALVVLDSDFAPAFAAQQGLEGRSLEDLAEEEVVRAAVQAAVDKGNAELARVEQVKNFTILRGDWAPGGDELTPTMKLKRKPIAEKYAGEIDAMYS
jgi:long-chain acyl-CoA synthetase